MFLTDETQSLIREIALRTSDSDGLSNGFKHILLMAAVSARGQNLHKAEEFIQTENGIDYDEFNKLVLEKIIAPSDMECLVLAGYAGHMLIKNGEIVGIVSAGFVNGYPHVDFDVLEEHKEKLLSALTALKRTTPDKTIHRVSYEKLNDQIRTSDGEFREPKPHPNILANYPFLQETPEELWKAFSESEESVLFLIGPPGTGKSTLIRMLVEARGWLQPPLRSNVYMVARQDVLLQPAFLEFLENLPKGSLVIVEDGDYLAEKRASGNPSMTTILDLVDGLVYNDIKFIFSTNLESLNSVDSALLREGRTFDILEFRLLTLEEANIARNAIDLPPIPPTTEMFTLAKALNWGKSRRAKRIVKTGF